jgi:hypothetical protein
VVAAAAAAAAAAAEAAECFKLHHNSKRNMSL